MSATCSKCGHPIFTFSTMTIPCPACAIAQGLQARGVPTAEPAPVDGYQIEDTSKEVLRLALAAPELLAALKLLLATCEGGGLIGPFVARKDARELIARLEDPSA
jgi:hypothetical protein